MFFLKVALLSMLFVLIFRKPNDENDMDYDYKDDGMPINKIRNLDWRLKYDSNVKFILNIKMFLNFVDIDFYYIFYKNQSMRRKSGIH